MNGVANLAPLIAACARLARHEEAYNPEALEALRTSLDSIFSILAELIAANPERRNWRANSNKPGYLVNSLSHGRESIEIHVPLTILDGFPPPEVLQEIAEIAFRIRSGHDTSICLSGSSAVYSAFKLVSDVDFCEYVDLSADTEGIDRSFARTIATAAALQDDQLLCFRIALFSDDRLGSSPVQVKRPWKLAPTRDDSFLQFARSVRAGKCDFIAQSRFHGTIEVTNMVLLVDMERPDEGSGERSFPFQEAPITASGGWVPRNLAEPLLIGQYVNWLYREAEELIGKRKLAKAAKRLYALSNALFRADIADQVLALWQAHSQNLGLASVLLARLELHTRLRGMSPDPAVLAFEGPLARTLATLADRANGLGLPKLEDADDAAAFSNWCGEAQQYLELVSSKRVARKLRNLLRELSGLLNE